MRVYVGQCRGKRFIRILSEAGIGECTQRDEFPPRRTPWFLDNGAFKDWTAGKPFDATEWRAAVAACRAGPVAPEFVVTPDLVAQGWDSLAFSVEHVGELAGLRPYLVTQDGMESDVCAVQRAAKDHGFAGMFVGGSLEWKLSTAVLWVDAAHAVGLPCHIGRVGNANRLRWAREIGADSVDSCQPLWCVDYLLAFVRAAQERQGRLFA